EISVYRLLEIDEQLHLLMRSRGGQINVFLLNTEKLDREYGEFELSSLDLEEVKVEGIEMTSIAFGQVIGWFPVVLSIAVVLFAFSTMISWSYYGEKSWEYLFGRTYVY